jgi:hypothetical protein
VSHIDPRGFGDDVIAWADRMVLIIETEVENMPRLDKPENWREWAESLWGTPDLAGQDAPRPDAFDTWQEWAERLFLTQEF